MSTGSVRIDGLHWHVWRARGPLYQRQVDANHAGCMLAVEQHMNASVNPRVNYAMALVGNKHTHSVAFAASYTAAIAREFGVQALCQGAQHAALGLLLRQ